MTDADDQLGGLGDPDSIEFDWGDSDAENSEAQTERDVLRFALGDVWLAADVANITEVTTIPTITEIPGLPAHVLGVAMMRRSIVSILDLAAFLGLRPTTMPDAGGRLIVVSDGDVSAGFAIAGAVELEVWVEDGEGPNKTDADDAMRPFVVSSRWAPGGRVVLLDLAKVVRAAAVR